MATARLLFLSARSREIKSQTEPYGLQGLGLCSVPNGHLSTSLNVPQLALIGPLVCHLSRGAKDREPCRERTARQGGGLLSLAHLNGQSVSPGARLKGKASWFSAILKALSESQCIRLFATLFNPFVACGRRSRETNQSNTLSSQPLQPSAKASSWSGSSLPGWHAARGRLEKAGYWGTALQLRLLSSSQSSYTDPQEGKCDQRLLCQATSPPKQHRASSKQCYQLCLCCSPCREQRLKLCSCERKHQGS